MRQIQSVEMQKAVQENASLEDVVPQVANSVADSVVASHVGNLSFLLSILTQDKSHLASASGDILEDLITKPEFLVLIIYIVMFFVGAMGVWQNSGSDVAEKSKEVRNQRDALQGTYLDEVGKIEGILMGMSESTASLAQWNFETNRRNFEKFMERVRDHPERFVENQDEAKAMVNPLREFLLLWLSVFQQCSLDPLMKPKLIVKDKDMSRCRNFVDLAGLVADQLGKNSVTFIDAWIKKERKRDPTPGSDDNKQDNTWFEFGNVGFGVVREDDKQDDDEDTDFEDDDPLEKKSAQSEQPVSYYPYIVKCGIAKVSVMSSNHAWLLGAFVVGLVAFLAQILVGQLSTGAMVLVAELCLVGILYKIEDLEEITRLQREVKQLQYMSDEVANRQEQLNDFYGKLRKLGQLWRYRTLPCMEHFQELYKTLLEIKGPEKAKYLEGVNQVWSAQMQGLGAIEDWIGDDPIPEEFLKLTTHQLNQATVYIEKHRTDTQNSSLVLSRVDRIFGFLIVRVLASFDLQNKGPLGQLSNPFVVLSLNMTGGNGMHKTEAVESDLNPRWGEEFFIPLAGSADTLELHVKDDQKTADPASMGYCRIKFRDITTGTWHRQKEKLWSAKKGNQKNSEIMYEVLFATELRQLRAVNYTLS